VFGIQLDYLVCCQLQMLLYSIAAGMLRCCWPCLALNPAQPSCGIQCVAQIVANAVNSIDVDKLDYLMRDAKMTGVPYQHDFTPLIHNSRVWLAGWVH
jgi:hypothetical protein